MLLEVDGVADVLPAAAPTASCEDPKRAESSGRSELGRRPDAGCRLELTGVRDDPGELIGVHLLRVSDSGAADASTALSEASTIFWEARCSAPRWCFGVTSLDVLAEDS